MLSLYEILKASKTGLAPDMWTALAGMNWGSADSGHEVKELTGIPPLSFRADGTPLLDYLISGNTVQNGTPTPSNPVDVVGVGVRTANLFNSAETDWETDILDDNGDPTGLTTSHYTKNFTAVEPKTPYYLSGTIYIKQSGRRIYYYDANKNWISRSTLIEYYNDGKFTTPANCKYVRFQVIVDLVSTSDWMLNTGSEALPYEPYGYKIPILSGGVTTNIYLGSTQTTRQIKKLVLDGTENIVYEPNYGTRFTFVVPDMLITGLRLTRLYCTHYQSIYDGRAWQDVPDNSIYTGGNDSTNRVFIKDTAYDDVIDYKAYLAAQYSAGTPVTVCYVLATEETATINEPLMKIDDYADTVSMEQAGVNIPTLHGNTVIDVETTLKPSEMYIKYQE